MINNAAKTFFTVISIAMALTFFSSCEVSWVGNSALVGRWDIVEPYEGRPKDMELLSNGTGIVDEVGVTYKTESGRFYVTRQSGGEKSYSYKVSGSALILTKDNGVCTENSIREQNSQKRLARG